MDALVFAGDDRVALGLGVAVHSATQRLTRSVGVFVLDTGMAANSRARLDRVYPEIKWIQVSADRLAGLPEVRYLTRGMYARLLIPELMPDVKRAVYLDADTVTRHDLAELFTCDLGGAPVAAVREFETPRVGERRNFNSGVLVLDCDRWRATGLAATVLSYVRDHADILRHPDQEALSAVNDSWHELDWRWNIQQALSWAHAIPRSEFTNRLVSERKALYQEAAVIHFSCTPKPWYHGCDAPGTWLWIRGLVASPYYSWRELLLWLSNWLAKRIAGRVLAMWRARGLQTGPSER